MFLKKQEGGAKEEKRDAGPKHRQWGGGGGGCQLLVLVKPGAVVPGGRGPDGQILAGQGERTGVLVFATQQGGQLLRPPAAAAAQSRAPEMRYSPHMQQQPPRGLVVSRQAQTPLTQTQKQTQNRTQTQNTAQHREERQHVSFGAWPQRLERS